MSELDGHPLVDTVIRSLVKGADEPWALPGSVLAELGRAAELDDGAELIAIAEGCLRLAHVLGDERQSPGAAARLLEVVAALATRLHALAERDAARLGVQVDRARQQYARQSAGDEKPATHNALDPPGKDPAGRRRTPWT